jgi:hypothetical protein
MKKAPYLKTLYLQRPLVLILFIAAFATLPWLGEGDLLPGTEQQELSAIQSFLHTGDLSILNSPEPHSTISRLLVAAFSSFTGEISPYILRLPSALAFIALMGFCFMFFAHRRPVLESFTSILILITSFGLYFSSTVANAYILPSFLVIGGIFETYRWLESRRKWKLVTTWLFWGTAAFELGWFVLAVPFAAFIIYLLIRRQPIRNVVGHPLLMAVPALLLGFVFYIILPHSPANNWTDLLFGYRSLVDGESWTALPFATKVLAPFSGFMPWTLLLLFAALGVPFIQKSQDPQYYNYPPVLPLDKVSQFNLLAAVVPFVGFLVLPASVLSGVFFIVCLLFTAIFMSRLIVHLSDMYPLIVRVFSVFLTMLALLFIVLGFLSALGYATPQIIWSHLPMQHSGGDIVFLQKINPEQWYTGIFLWIGLVVATVVDICFLFRKKNLKILMATVGLIYAMQLFINSQRLSDYYPAAQHCSRVEHRHLDNNHQ